MKLSDFIQDQRGRILKDWDAFAESRIPATDRMSRVAVRDHAGQILDYILQQMRQRRAVEKQDEQASGEIKKESENENAAEIHGALRLAAGFDLVEMSAEFRAMRSNILTLWLSEHPGTVDNEGVVAFNQAIDTVMNDSLTSYTDKMSESQDLFLGIIGHDLRSPLGAILNCAQLLGRDGTASDRQKLFLNQIQLSANAALSMVGDLLDLTRLRLGSGIPIRQEQCDLAPVLETVVAEQRAAHPGYAMELEYSTAGHGLWDCGRLSQVFANIIGNAVKHGTPGMPIHIRLEEFEKEVVISVNNQGKPIPPELLPNLFDRMVTSKLGAETSVTGASLGLGLYITKEIVNGHAGQITVESTAEAGTTFAVHLPR